MGYYKIVGTQVHTSNTQIDSEFKQFTKEILEDGTEMYQPQELQDALDALKLEEDKIKQIAEAKQYLQDTDYKVLPDYDGNTDGVIEARAEARALIRGLEG
jgi:deoxyribodipyrimidine photolyase